jgi:hypothetical protein
VDTYSGIRQTLARYALGFDGADFDLLAGCFTEDASVGYPDGSEVTGRGALIRQFRQMRSAHHGQVRHFISNTAILSETDSTVESVSYVLSIVTEPDGSIRAHRAGWYRDTFRLEDGVWRFARRIVRADGQGEPVNPLTIGD